jgi:rubrerythrin
MSRKETSTPPKSITLKREKGDLSPSRIQPVCRGFTSDPSREESRPEVQTTPTMAEQLRLEQVALGVDAVVDDAFSRGRFVRNGLVAGAGGLLGGGAAAFLIEPDTADARSRKQDRRILRFLLELEYLQAEFYSAAAARGRLRGELKEFAEVVAAQEREHVALLEKRLGRSAGPKPTFNFGDTIDSADAFARTARRLEETGVAAYIGQGANLTARTVATIARITSVEARHAAWIADFLGRNPAPLAADKAQTSRQVQAAIRGLGFLR